MQYQLQETIDAFGEKIEGSITSTGSGYLYTVNGGAETLNANKKELFYYVIAKLL